MFLLLRHENIAAKQLAEELCVSTRTIYRDINILSVAGIPITLQKRYGGGLSLLQGSLNKVAGLFSHNLQSEWLEVDFSYWGSPEKERNNITTLECAIINKYMITFPYFNAELTIKNQM